MNSPENIPGVSDAISAPDSTQALVGVDEDDHSSDTQNMFSRQLSEYQTVYNCFVQEMLKSQSEVIEESENNMMRQERERLDAMEQKLHRIARKMANEVNSSQSKSAQLERQLEMVQTPPAEEEETPATEEPNDKQQEEIEKMNMDSDVQLRQLSNYAGQQASSGAYARLFYTRLLFWVIMSIMLLIVLFRAATSSEPGFLMNVIGVVIGLVIVYYVMGFMYNRIF